MNFCGMKSKKKRDPATINSYKTRYRKLKDMYEQHYDHNHILFHSTSVLLSLLDSDREDGVLEKMIE